MVVFLEIIKRIILFVKLGLYLVIGQCVYLFSALVKKNKNIWVFGATRGDKYVGNARYLFEYVNNCEPGIRAVWLTKNKSIVQRLDADGHECYHFYSFSGLKVIMSSGVVFVTNGGLFGDVPYCGLGKGTKLVQLWHGSPIKKIGYDDPLFCNKRTLYATIRDMLGRRFKFIARCNNPDVLISTSKEVQKIFQSAFAMELTSLPILGNPRDDIFYRAKRHDLNVNCRWKVIYLPTFRGLIGSVYDPFTNFDFNLLNEKLKKANTELIVKLHPYNILPDHVISSIDSSSNIFIYSKSDIYEEICTFDCLITDYSSILFDYLHLNRPVLFLPLDYNTYIVNDREFYYNYNEITPGKKCDSWDSAVGTICNMQEVIDNKEYMVQRLAVSSRFHAYKDGCSSRRVSSYVKHMLQGQ